jgi:FixJ family two-component response regulator
MRPGPPSKAAPLVYVVDDDAGVRASLSLLLRSVGLDVAEFADPRLFLDGLQPERPGCVILDLRMPAMSGLEVLERLRLRSRSLPVVMISAHAEVETAVQAMKHGACDFLQKPYASDALLERVQAAAATHVMSLEAELARLRVGRRLATLSDREREVLCLLALGHPTKAIADVLAISAKTVDNHRSSLLKKTGTHSAVELAHLAHLAGLTPVPAGLGPDEPA